MCNETRHVHNLYAAGIGAGTIYEVWYYHREGYVTIAFWYEGRPYNSKEQAEDVFYKSL